MRLAVLIAGKSRGLQPIKHEALLTALAAHFPGMQVWDVEPHPVARALTLLRTIRPDRHNWRGRFNAHPAMFDARTAAVGRLIAEKGRQIDAFLQIGINFDAPRVAGHRPVVIYTDYAATLTRRLGRQWRQDLTETQVLARLAKEKQTLASARHLCTRSKLVADAIMTDHAIPAERLSVVGGGPNLLPKGERAAPMRFLFIGNEFLRKGGDLVLAAFQRLQILHPTACLDIVAPVRHRVDLPGLTWHANPGLEGLRDLLGAASVILVPSRFETWGDVLIEAMAGGAVPIIPDLPPMTEIARHEVEGLVMPVLDADSLFVAMDRLFRDEGLCGRLSQAARDRISCNFTTEKVALRLAQAITGAFT